MKAFGPEMSAGIVSLGTGRSIAVSELGLPEGRFVVLRSVHAISSAARGGVRVRHFADAGHERRGSAGKRYALAPGESGGVPRDIHSPDINTDDFGAAVDYLLSRDDAIPFDAIAAFFRENL